MMIEPDGSWQKWGGHRVKSKTKTKLRVGDVVMVTGRPAEVLPGGKCRWQGGVAIGALPATARAPVGVVLHDRWFFVAMPIVIRTRSPYTGKPELRITFLACVRDHELWLRDRVSRGVYTMTRHALALAIAN